MDWLKDMPFGSHWASANHRSSGTSFVLVDWNDEADCPIMQRWQDGVPTNTGLSWTDWEGDRDPRVPHPHIKITYQYVEYDETLAR